MVTLYAVALPANTSKQDSNRIRIHTCSVDNDLSKKVVGKLPEKSVKSRAHAHTYTRVHNTHTHTHAHTHTPTERFQIGKRERGGRGRLEWS